jgi:hypothetical protein
MVCSINRVFAPRLKAQHPLAAPHGKTDQTKATDQDQPDFRPHPARKCLRTGNHIIDALTKAIARRGQRFFVLSGEDQGFFGRRRHGAVALLGHHKATIVDIIGGNQRRGNEQAGSGKNAEAHGGGPRVEAPHIRSKVEWVNRRPELVEGRFTHRTVLRQAQHFGSSGKSL